MGSLFRFEGTGCFSFALGSLLKHLIVTITARSIWLSSYLLLGFFKMTITVSLATKFEIENINGKIDFNLWHIKMCAFLVQQGLLKALNTTKKSSCPSVFFPAFLQIAVIDKPIPVFFVDALQSAAIGGL